MFWPIILPFTITLLSFVTLVTLCTVFAPKFQWKRGNALAIAVLLACVAFIPSCAATMAVTDWFHFGVFQYDLFADVSDFRVERYLPTKARNITVEKYAQGHRAKYSISESDLKEYINGLWEKYGDQSRMSRDDLHSDSYITQDQRTQFGDLGWPVLENAIELHSPVKSNWAGATYYFDRDSKTAYHRAGYW